MELVQVFERPKNFLVTEQRLRGHIPKLVNALRSRCLVTRENFCSLKTSASTIPKLHIEFEIWTGFLIKF